VVTTKLGNWMKGGGQGGQLKPSTDTPKPKSPIKCVGPRLPTSGESSPFGAGRNPNEPSAKRGLARRDAHDSSARTLSTHGASVRRLYKRELGMGVFNLLVGLYGIFVVDNIEYSLCIIFQGLMFCAFGLNLMDDSLECDQCASWAAPWSPLTHKFHAHQKKKAAAPLVT
jgi:hypothetical protein